VEREAVDEFTVFHADDLDVSGVSRAIIERAYWTTKTNWVVDPDQRCRTDDKEAVRRALGISQDWPSA